MSNVNGAGNDIVKQREEYLSLELSLWTINCLIALIYFDLNNDTSLTPAKEKELRDREKLLCDELDELYSGDGTIMNKILHEYVPEVKQGFIDRVSSMGK
ncbi:MAG: hypothetical protein LBR80_00205 [Deltaproteobacteria bacterium]|jgi:hypothetical protein|nr:hypothetical protein [Deltaproteobacteria bacterium]